MELFLEIPDVVKREDEKEDKVLSMSFVKNSFEILTNEFFFSIKHFLSYFKISFVFYRNKHLFLFFKRADTPNKISY